MPVTAILGDHVQITWTVPSDGSSSILGYTVVIRESDGVTYTEEPISCNGIDLGVHTTQSCRVPISRLIVEPWELVWGSHIYAKVAAINIVG